MRPPSNSSNAIYRCNRAPFFPGKRNHLAAIRWQAAGDWRTCAGPNRIWHSMAVARLSTRGAASASGTLLSKSDKLFAFRENVACKYNYNKMQSEMADVRPPPLCRHLSNWTKHDSDPLAALCENMTSSTKPEVHNVSHCRQRRTEPRPHMYRKLGEIWTTDFFER